MAKRKFTLAALIASVGLMTAAQTFTATNGINYTVVSEDDATVEIAPGNYTGRALPFNDVTASDGSKEYTVIGIGENAFKGQTLTSASGNSIWYEAQLVYIKAGAFEGTSLTGTMNFMGFRGAHMDIDEKALRGNVMNRFNFANADNLVDLSTLGSSTNHGGLAISKDLTVLFNYPGKHYSGASVQTTSLVTSYTVLASIKKIAPYAFWKNPSLRTVTLPAGLEEIGEEAFYGATALTSFTIPAGVTTLGPGFIAGATKINTIAVNENNTAFKAVEGCVYTIDDATLVAVPYGKTVLTVADGCTTVGAKAALDGQLTEVNLPATLTTIGDDAFKGNNDIMVVKCDAVTPPAGAVFSAAVYENAQLIIPEGSEAAYKADPNWGKFFAEYQVPTDPFQVNNFWYQAVDENFVTLIAAPDGTPYAGVANAWFSQVVQYTDGHKFTVNAMSDNALKNATVSGTFTLPASIATIGAHAFDGCNLTTLTIPAAVTSLGAGVINNTTALASVAVESDNTAYTAKGGCIYNAEGTTLLAAPSGIRSLSLDETVTATAADAFVGAKSIATVNAQPAVAPQGGVFDDEVYQNATLWVYPESAESYTGHENWGKFVAVKRIGVDVEPFKSGNLWYMPTSGDEVEIIKNPDGTPYKNVSETWFKDTVTDADGNTYTITAIGEYAFEDATCIGGTNANITNIGCAGITTIKAFAFKGTQAIILRLRYNTLTDIDPEAFAGNKIRRIFIQNQGEGSQYANSSNGADLGLLTNLAMDKLVAYPGDMRVNGGYRDTDARLTSTTLIDQYKTIGAHAFDSNSNIKTITVNAEAIENNAFKNTVITSFNGGEKLVSVDSAAFAGCEALESIVLPATVTTIASDAFTGAKAITRIQVDATVAPEGGVFEPEVYENAELIIPEGSEASYKAHPNWGKFFGAAPIKGDVNGDGCVDATDLNIVVMSIVNDNRIPAYDVSGDGSVDVVDVNIIVAIILETSTGDDM